MLNIFTTPAIIVVSILEAISNNKLITVLSLALLVVFGLLIISLTNAYKLKRDKNKFNK